jgi:hypothetical protein
MYCQHPINSEKAQSKHQSAPCAIRNQRARRQKIYVNDGENKMLKPFAWYRYQQGDRVYYDSKKWDDCQPLYAHPKKWVGLTVKEILDLFDSNNVYGSKWIEFARIVEAKLKENNA